MIRDYLKEGDLISVREEHTATPKHCYIYSAIYSYFAIYSYALLFIAMHCYL